MPGGFRMLLQLVLVTRLGWTVADVRADDTVCSLQKSSPLQANSFSSLNLDGATLPERPGAFGPSSSFDGFIPSDLWSTPGLTFRHCAAPRPASAPHGLLQQEQYPRRRRPAWTALSPKPKCVGPQVPIGRFVQGSYTFTCCAAGEQCGGCRLEQGGSCMQCAAGYVMQTIPILNTSKCFVCDDVPNWHDKEGRSCADLESLGICSGTWPNKDQDVAFHGIRPSEACCACGGGSIYPTPVYMPLQFQSLYVGQNINQTPQPVTAGVQQVAPGCELASSGLELSNDGRVLGVVTLQNQSVIKCSTVSVQDPVRGLVSNIDFSLPVSAFSYGDQIVHFKFWGLDASPPQQIIAPHTTLPAAISGARLHCDPHCPWLSVTTAGVLHWNPSVPTTSAQPVPAELSSQVTTLSGMPSCSCQVLALFQGTPSSSSLFLAAQSRLWKGAVWEWSFLLARVGAELAPVRLLEDLGSGFRWYNRSGHVLEVQVAENIATGEKMVLPQSVPPTILDVDCVDDAGNTLTWSRINGDVRRQSQVAFKLDPATGTVSGTPLLGLSSTQGRAEVNVTCQVALGGPLYDMELPVAVLQVHILDDVCWVPRNISGSFRWQKVTASGEGLCLQQCRLREDCAAIIFSAGTCELMVSDGNESFVPEALALVRLNNCSEQDASLNLTVPDAQYLQGEFSVMNVYHDTASYSRPGSNPKRQLLLSRTENVQQIPTSCAKSSWMLLHINSSDFEDAQSKNAPEFFGDPMACIDSDVVGNTFQQGQVAFDLHLLPAELQAKPTKLRTAALQPATLALSAPSCPKPTLPNLMLGSVQDSSLYSLHPCDCFGAAHAHVAPVDAASNAAVPRNAQGHFNNGSVSDRRLFSGPYTCEETASVGQFPHLDMEACQKACASEPKCQFYLFGKTSQTCTLFQSCNYIQDVGLQVVNELYGIPPPNANYCRIANPQQCWQEIRRRSMLSFTPSDLPMCLFQEQADACDALQLLLGKQDGPCTRCEYIDATSPFAATGLQKTPPPESFSSASQISVACNDTSTMFSRLQAGLQWEGPRQNPVTFTCVSGEWVGELGIWQDMSNFTCERCLQVGSGTLQRLSLVSMPEIYFLEHRQVHLNYPFSIHGCSRAGFLTASPLLSTGMGMFLGVAKDQSLKLFSAATGASWWIDAYSDQLRVKDGSLDPRKNWCVCYDKMPLYACACSSSHMLLMQGGLLQGGQQCASANATGALDFTACPQSQLRSNVEFLWHFESGDCFFGFDLQNTAEKLWTATSEASGSSGPPLRLGNFAFKSSSSQQGLFQIYLDYPPFNARLCLHADLTKKNGGGYPMVISSDCASAFMWRGAHLAYFHQGDFTTTYYLEMNVDALIVTRTTNPGAQFNFKISKGAISPSTQPNMCLQAQWNDVATTHNGARSQVAGINIPPYTPCSSYGEFSGINEVNGTYEQVCRASPLLFYQDTKPAQCMTLSAANQQFPHLNLAEGLPGTPSPDALIVFCADFGYVLSNATWPAEIPPYNHTGNGVQQQCSAFCSYIGSKYTSVSQAHHFPNNAEPATLDPTTHLMNFSCPETKLLRGVVYNMFAAICEGPWLTEIKEDPSSETPVFFNDCNATLWTQSWSIQTIHQQNASSTWMELQSCEASLSVAMSSNPNPNADARPLNLSVLNASMLSPKELMAYTRAPGIHIATKQSDNILFTCLPGHAEGPLLDGNLTTLCASNAAVKVSDLYQATSLFMDEVQTLLMQKNCPVLMEAGTTVDPNVAVNTAGGGMTMQQLSHLLRLAYHTTPFGDPHPAPFNYTGPTAAFAEVVGFLSLQPGGAPWGLRCPPGAVVASDSSTMPYCRQLDAAAEKTFYSFSGSIACPDGSAVSGWYNLPNVPVEGGPYGGPSNATALRLFCRSTPLLSSCQQPMASYCQSGGIVNSVSFDSNQFKLGCCQLQRRLGMALTSQPRHSRIYQDFEGYYCPSQMDITGAPSYVKTLMPSLGSPSSSSTSSWTLSWNRFAETWELASSSGKVFALPGSAETPVAVNASGSAFSASFIEPLTAAYVMGSTPQTLFPSQKPTAPVLMSFQASPPNYKVYCDPAFRQNPYAFAGAASIPLGNPCYHTYNTMPAQLQPAPKQPLLKGITEEAFWQCSERSKRRKYLNQMNVADKEKLANMIAAKQATIQQITLGVELAAGLVGMIPWGSFAMPGAKGAEEAEQQVAQESVAVVKREVDQQLLTEAEVEKLTRRGTLESSFMEDLKRAVSNAGQAVASAAYSVGAGIAGGLYNFGSSTLQNIGNNPVGSFQDFMDHGVYAQQGITGIISSNQHVKPPTPPSPQALINMSKELVQQTVPTLTGQYVPDATLLADAAQKDCLPLQYGLSKVMCDLFCIDDAVRTGTSSVLTSLQNSHMALMTNIRALLDYQTRYLLWAMGSPHVATPTHARAASAASEILSLPALLQELTSFPQTEENPTSTLVLDREVLDWHKETADDLILRLKETSLTNTTNDSVAYWPHRVRAMKGMLHHYHQSLSDRLKPSNAWKTSNSAQNQIKDKLRRLSDQASEHREVAQAVKVLRMPPLSAPARSLDVEAQVVWTSLLESFLHTHEKHDTFTMLHLKALDQTDDAVLLAQNFSECAGADTASMRESWERALHADERCSEALLEAWSATITTAERLEVAIKDQGFLDRMVSLLHLQPSLLMSPSLCQNRTAQAAWAQEAYAGAVKLVVSSFNPLALQMSIFKVLATFQEQQLKQRRLEYLEAPGGSATSSLRTLLEAVADPNSSQGQALALRALEGFKDTCGEDFFLQGLNLRSEPVKSFLLL